MCNEITGINPINQHSMLICKATVCFSKVSRHFHLLSCLPIPNWLKRHGYEANHAFANSTGGRYDEDDAALAFARTLTFLESYLRG